MNLKTVSCFWGSKVPVPKTALCEAVFPQTEVLFSNLPLKLGQSGGQQGGHGLRISQSRCTYKLAFSFESSCLAL